MPPTLPILPRPLFKKVDKGGTLFQKEKQPLKSVLEKAVYNKEKHQYKGDFSLNLYSKLLK